MFEERSRFCKSFNYMFMLKTEVKADQLKCADWLSSRFEPIFCANIGKVFHFFSWPDRIFSDVWPNVLLVKGKFWWVCKVLIMLINTTLIYKMYNIRSTDFSLSGSCMQQNFLEFMDLVLTKWSNSSKWEKQTECTVN